MLEMKYFSPTMFVLMKCQTKYNLNAIEDIKIAKLILRMEKLWQNLTRSSEKFTIQINIYFANLIYEKFFNNFA